MNHAELLREVLKEDFNVTDEWILERFTIESHPRFSRIVIDPFGEVEIFGVSNVPFILKSNIRNILIIFKEKMGDKSFEQIISESILNDRPHDQRLWFNTHRHVGNLGSPTYAGLPIIQENK